MINYGCFWKTSRLFWKTSCLCVWRVQFGINWYSAEYNLGLIVLLLFNQNPVIWAFHFRLYKKATKSSVRLSLLYLNERLEESDFESEQEKISIRNYFILSFLYDNHATIKQTCSYRTYSAPIVSGATQAKVANHRQKDIGGQSQGSIINSI